MRWLQDLGAVFGRVLSIIPRTDRRADVKAAAKASDAKLAALKKKKAALDAEITRLLEKKP